MNRPQDRPVQIVVNSPSAARILAGGNRREKRWGLRVIWWASYVLVLAMISLLVWLAVITTPRTAVPIPGQGYIVAPWPTDGPIKLPVDSLQLTVDSPTEPSLAQLPVHSLELER